MKIAVKVKTNARKNEVVKIDETTYAVSVTASPIEGKANKAVVELLAKYFDVPKSLIMIQQGHANSKKVVWIDR